MTLLEPGTRWRNWGRSEASNPVHIARPTSIDEVVKVIHLAQERRLTVKPIGAGHSFTAIGATDGIQVDISAIDGVLAVDGNLVTLGAGTNLYQLPALLGPHGLALANMGDIDRQTIAGATSTGTHGTGRLFGGLATQIRALTLVTARGEVLHVAQGDPIFNGVALGLGAFGVLVDITIECVPAFAMQAVERAEEFELVADEWAQRTAASDHFEFYVFPGTSVVATKTNTRMHNDADKSSKSRLADWFEDVVVNNWALAAMCNVGMVMPAVTPRLNHIAAKVSSKGVFTGHSHDVFVSPRTTRFREMEYNIAQEAIPDALRDVRKALESKKFIVSFPIEVRSAASDDLWLSTASGRESGYIAFHRYYREDPTEYFRVMEDIMVAYDGRPHWGKIHTRDAGYLDSVYPHFADFVALRDQLDPARMFANAYLDRVLGL